MQLPLFIVKIKKQRPISISYLCQPLISPIIESVFSYGNFPEFNCLYRALMDTGHTVDAGISPLRRVFGHLDVIRWTYIGTFSTSDALAGCIKSGPSDDKTIKKWICHQAHEFSCGCDWEWGKLFPFFYQWG